MKIPKLLLTLILLSSIACSTIYEETHIFNTELKQLFDKKEMVKDEKKVKFDDSVTAGQVADEMGFGFNLGNTFDAFSGTKQNQGLSSETCWGVTETSQEIIEGLVEKGFRSIRIPVTWHNHLIDEKYTIDPEWMLRVKEVVDWSIKAGLYVILNTHHDNAAVSEKPVEYGKGYYPSRKDLPESSRFLYNIWSQIAAAFNSGYGHQLIFETLNEPRPVGTDFEWNYKKGELLCEEASSVLNEFNTIIVKAIRESGGNNEKRFIMVTPLAAAYGAAVASDFIFPGDSQYNPTNPKIMLSVHMYLPYNFAMNKDMNYVTFEEAYANELYSDFKSLYENFVLKGHQVVVGEMGTIDKNNTEARIEWAKFYTENSRKFNLPIVIWDNQFFKNPNYDGETFGCYHRDTLEWDFEEYIDSFVELSKTPFENNPAEVFGDSLLKNPFEFLEWQANINVGSGTFSSFNSYSTLCFTVDAPSYKPDYASLILFLGDWSSPLMFDAKEIIGATTNNEGGFILPAGKKANIEVFMNEKNLQLVKERGIFIIGHGFQMTKLYISGPKLSKIDPLTITRSKSKEQSIKLYFSEDASPFVGGIKFLNDYYDLNTDVECELNSKDNTRIDCKGNFKFTGEYKIADAYGVLLSSRSVNVVPEEGGQPNIKNFIDAKVNLDAIYMEGGIRLSSAFFEDAIESSKLIIETGDLVISPSFKVLFIYNGNSKSIMHIDAKNVNANVGDEGGIALKESKVIITLGDNVKTVQDVGITLRGYGFSVKAIYLK